MLARQTKLPSHTLDETGLQGIWSGLWHRSQGHDTRLGQELNSLKLKRRSSLPVTQSWKDEGQPHNERCAFVPRGLGADPRAAWPRDRDYDDRRSTSPPLPRPGVMPAALHAMRFTAS